MAASSDGFIRLHRRIQEHPYWDDQERLRAWLDCLFMAAWRNHRRMIGTRQVELQRGEFIASDRFLAQRWGWSRGKVRRFLKAAQEEGEIEPTNETSNGTTYLVVNYDTYQDGRPTNSTSDRTTIGPPVVPPPDQREVRERREGTTTPYSPPSSNDQGGHDDVHDQGDDDPPDELEAWFEDVFKDAYPKRNGRYRWARSLRRLRARLKEGHDRDEILDAVKRYARWCEVTGKLNTETVMQAATFLGQDFGENLANPWAPPTDDPRRFGNEPHPDSEAARVKEELPRQNGARSGPPEPRQRELDDGVDDETRERIREWARANKGEASALWQRAENSLEQLTRPLRKRGADDRADAMVRREFFRMAQARGA